MPRQVSSEVMTATNASKDKDRLECISEAHLQYMREFISWEEAASKKTLDLFLAGKLRQAIDSKTS
jgi:hypothetical protein